MWADHETPWADARVLAGWVRRAISEIGGANLLPLAARVRDLRVISDTADSLEAAVSAARLKFEALQEHVRTDFRAALGRPDYDSVPMAHLANLLPVWLARFHVI